MNTETQFSVTATLDSGESLSFHSDSTAQVFAWCNGVNQTAALLGRTVEFDHSTNTQTPRWETNFS